MKYFQLKDEEDKDSGIIAIHETDIVNKKIDIERLYTDHINETECFCDADAFVDWLTEKGIACERIFLEEVRFINEEPKEEVWNPKTILDQWKRYDAEIKKHEERFQKTKPKTRDYVLKELFDSDFNKWVQDKSMSEPNKPGYYRANND